MPWPLNELDCQLAYSRDDTMKEIGVFEAENRLGTLLDWVEQGEES